MGKILERVNKMNPYIILIQLRLSEKILLYITVIFVLTGIYRFQPDILVQLFEGYTANAGGQDISLQEYWQVAITVIVAIEMIYSAVRLIYKKAGLTELLLSPVASFLAYILVDATDFVGDRMLVIYLLWWVIKNIDWWLLKKTDFEIITIHKAGSMGTAICLPKENEMHGRTKFNNADD